LRQLLGVKFVLVLGSVLTSGLPPSLPQSGVLSDRKGQVDGGDLTDYHFGVLLLLLKAGLAGGDGIATRL